MTTTGERLPGQPRTRSNYPERFEVRLTIAQRDAVAELAEARGRSVGSLIRQALDELIDADPVVAGPGDPVADRAAGRV